MNAVTYGVDIAKNVFQLYWVDLDTGELCTKPLKRANFLAHFANQAPCLIGMEACGGAHHWARRLTDMGHTVKLMPVGRAALSHRTTDVLQRLSDRLPAMLIDTLREHWNMLTTLDQQIASIEKRLQAWLQHDKSCKTIAAIPGVGLLTATAAVATMGDAKTFRSGREFAAWLGLVPAQTGTGGRVRLLGISKRGDTYLRTLLIHGARSAATHAKELNAWATALGKRRPHNVVVVALANKMARTIWALLAHERQYVPHYVCSKQ
jgi:transposase